MEKFHKEMPMGCEPKCSRSKDYDDATIVLKNYGDNKAGVITAIKIITVLNTTESYNLLAPERQIKIGIAYVDAKHYKKLLEKAGATLEIMEYTPKKNIKVMKIN